jgi:hypothetical protein
VGLLQWLLLLLAVAETLDLFQLEVTLLEVAVL